MIRRAIVSRMRRPFAGVATLVPRGARFKAMNFFKFFSPVNADLSADQVRAFPSSP